MGYSETGNQVYVSAWIALRQGSRGSNSVFPDQLCSEENNPILLRPTKDRSFWFSDTEKSARIGRPIGDPFDVEFRGEDTYDLNRAVYDGTPSHAPSIPRGHVFAYVVTNLTRQNNHSIATVQLVSAKRHTRICKERRKEPDKEEHANTYATTSRHTTS